tara:strand:- start:186 stop:386 length:201 start_codon:yes stop_codon:yes gene_type:complete
MQHSATRLLQHLSPAESSAEALLFALASQATALIAVHLCRCDMHTAMQCVSGGTLFASISSGSAYA